MEIQILELQAALQKEQQEKKLTQQALQLVRETYTRMNEVWEKIMENPLLIPQMQAGTSAQVEGLPSLAELQADLQREVAHNEELQKQLNDARSMPQSPPHPDNEPEEIQKPEEITQEQWEGLTHYEKEIFGDLLNADYTPQEAFESLQVIKQTDPIAVADEAPTVMSMRPSWQPDMKRLIKKRGRLSWPSQPSSKRAGI